MEHVVALTGSGISAESGLSTFREANGLWHNYRIDEVATPQAWEANPELVLEFYNERRRQVVKARPNAGHLALAQLEAQYLVTIITQNVDDLHERAGSSHIVHLHGEILKSRSSIDPGLVYDTAGQDIRIGAKCAKGSQLRPHIVWFGEEVSLMSKAAEITQTADILVVVGTSLSVYPAAALVNLAPSAAKRYIVDTQIPPHAGAFCEIPLQASVGLPKLVSELLSR
jgi:NAD-dependent deacetylase